MAAAHRRMKPPASDRLDVPIPIVRHDTAIKMKAGNNR